MKTWKLITIIVLFILKLNTFFAQSICPIIPAPAEVDLRPGNFEINDKTAVILQEGEYVQTYLAQYLQNELQKRRGIALKIKKSSKNNRILLIKTFAQAANSSAYSLEISGKEIKISAPTNQGLFYGIISLLQLVAQSPDVNKLVSIDCWSIHDVAQYEWRGFMLDESRHFFGKEMVKSLLDWMAFYKLDRFHWHLTDETAWRLQIKQYPKLTTIGAIGNTTQPNAPAEFYTQEDISEILQYARDRYITIIPEIDMPGHATASNRAYPQYSGGGNGKYADYTFNPGADLTYTYLTNILRETAALFPEGMVHLGGDEVSIGNMSWSGDKDVRTLMQKYHLENLKEVEKYFVKRMTDSALLFNKTVGLWDEAADYSLPVKKTVLFWWHHDHPEQLEKALDKGYDMVFCPRIPLYFDFIQDSSHRVGRKWQDGQFSSVKQVYEFSPLSYVKNTQQKKQILGIQANLWTETVVTKNRLQYLIFPRLAALAEAAWVDPGRKNYSQFINRLQYQFQLYKRDGISYYDPTHPDISPEIKH